MTETDRIEHLRAEARYREERLRLYRAKAYGPRATSGVRLAEKEREYARAVERLQQALDEAGPAT